MSKKYAEAMHAAAQAIGNGVEAAASYSAKAAATANGVSAASQAAQGAFNQASVNNANAISSANLANQWAYNSAQAAMANEYNTNMWNQTAAWNENMWERMAAFNAAEAQKNRDWQERMASTQYQRAIKDMKTAGLNPVLAVTGGGISAGSGGGSAASVGGSSMSPASANMASGGLLGGQSASESSYTGQMEYLSGTLGLISAAVSGITSAIKCLDQVPNSQNIMEGLFDFWEKYTPYGNAWHLGKQLGATEKAIKSRYHANKAASNMKGALR